jgi:hypothetical protein
MILGLIQGSQERKDQAAKAKHDYDLSRDDKLVEIRKHEIQLEYKHNEPIETHTKRVFLFFGLPVGYETVRQAPHVAHRVRHGGFLLGLLVFTYCIAVLALVNAGGEQLATFDPASRATELGLAWGILSYSAGGSHIAYVSAAALGVWLLNPIVFIMSAWITGIAYRK